ncbi:MAG: capsule assembly Wzi family protein [Gemmatimonadota bacterium]
MASALSGGAYVGLGPLSAAVHPTLILQDHGSLEAVPLYETIDWPQARGSELSTIFDPGQSFIRVDLLGLAAGLSNENLWWGPARTNPILFSNTAPGFPHVFFGTGRPLDLWVGHLEAEVLVGELEESAYFNDDPTDDRRHLSAFGVAFHPRGLEGIALGFAGVQITGADEGEGLLRTLLGVAEGSNPAGNALGSVFARWRLPESAFALYAELGRDDLWDGLPDLLGEPEHSLAYVVGLEKGLDLDGGWIHGFAELVHLQASNSFRTGRPMPGFYTHSSVRQGHTQQGQLLGAPVGPGSNAILAGADLFAGWGQVGITLERTTHANDAYLRRVARRGLAQEDRRDVEHAIELRHTVFIGPVDLRWSFGLGYRPERGLVELLSDEEVSVPDLNVALRLGLRWYPGAERVAPPAWP